MEIIPLFAAPVARFSLGAPTEAEAAHLDAICSELTFNVGNKTSKHRTALNDPELAGLRARVDGALAAYVREVVAPARPVNLGITQSWLNRTELGQYHHRHAHPGSLYSGVYYVAAGESDKITFFRGGYQRIKFPPAVYNPWNSDAWWIPARTGDLVIFPSELEHAVPNVEAGVRVSLSFNTWFDGSCGSEDDLTHLAVSLAGPYAVTGDDKPQSAV